MDQQRQRRDDVAGSQAERDKPAMPGGNPHPGWGPLASA